MFASKKPGRGGVVVGGVVNAKTPDGLLARLSARTSILVRLRHAQASMLHGRLSAPAVWLTKQNRKALSARVA
jgi:hypothetical protein